MHFSGSQNWLSYRGDRFPRGETVYQVTIPIEVEKAYNHLAQRFIERATLLWARENDEDRRSALCILGYLGQEQEALTWIQEKAYYHFVPLWLALAYQAISNGQEERILAPLQTLLEPSKLEIDLPDSSSTEINQALQGVLKRIGRKKPELTATLVNGNPRKRDAESSK